MAELFTFTLAKRPLPNEGVVWVEVSPGLWTSAYLRTGETPKQAVEREEKMWWDLVSMNQLRDGLMPIYQEWCVDDR